MTHTRVAAIEGWFTLDDEPHLLGTRCSESGTFYFPPETTMSRAPGCSAATLEPVQLSRIGRVWSYTNAGYKPPPPYIAMTDPHVPFVIAAVELIEERIVILGQMVGGVTVDDLAVGDEVEVALDTLHFDDGGNEVVVWKWKPTGRRAEGAQ